MTPSRMPIRGHTGLSLSIIQLALLKLGTDLALRNNSEEGQLFWLNEVDLGFPVAE